MKRSTLPLTLTLTAASGLWMSTLFAQQPAPAAPPAPAPPPAADGAPAAPATGNFKDEKERRSYGLGSFLASREKSAATNQPERGPVNVEEILAGLADGLSSAKSQNYASGLAMAMQIKRSGMEVDPAVLTEALRAGLSGQPAARMTPAEVQAVMQQINTDLQQQQQAKQKAEAEKNLAAANAFLEKNKTAEGVQVTPSGLQYKIEKPGEGATPGMQEMVTLNIVGTLPEGQEFERSPEGAPSKRPVASVVKGLQEGLQLLKVGGKARFWVPPALGHGETQRGPLLKPNSVLVYDVELLGTEPAPARPAGNPLQNRPATAVTPPVSVDIPQPAKQAPATTPPVQVPAAPPATPPQPAPPAPAPEAK